MPYLDFLRIFTTIDRCRVFDATWSVASHWIRYNVEPRSSGKFHIALKKDSEVVIALSQPDTRYYGDFTSEFIYTLAFHVYDENDKLIRRARITVPYSKRSVNCELELKAGTFTVIPHVEREPTDILPETGENRADNAVSPATQSDDVTVISESVQMDKSSYMFKQRKASLVRNMSLARVTGRKLLGVDDEDYEIEPKKLEEEHWQLMLGLRVYSHDPNIKVTGTSGIHPVLKGAEECVVLDSKDKEDPEEVTATLADKELVAEPEEDGDLVPIKEEDEEDEH